MTMADKFIMAQRWNLSQTKGRIEFSTRPSNKREHKRKKIIEIHEFFSSGRFVNILCSTSEHGNFVWIRIWKILARWYDRTRYVVRLNQSSRRAFFRWSRGASIYLLRVTICYFVSSRHSNDDSGQRSKDAYNAQLSWNLIRLEY